jgi:hypothetical protein
MGDSGPRRQKRCALTWSPIRWTIMFGRNPALLASLPKPLRVLALRVTIRRKGE